MFEDITEYQDSAFEFKRTDHNGTVNTMTFKAETWLEALENFIVFLKAARFELFNDSTFVNGNKHPFVDTSLEMFYPDTENTSFNYGANHGGND